MGVSRRLNAVESATFRLAPLSKGGELDDLSVASPMKSEHVLNSARQNARLRHKRAGLDLCMSELNLTLTAKPSTVSTGVNWTQNATILHRHHHRRHRCRCRGRGRCAKCTAFADAMVFVVCKTGSRRWMTAPWNTSVSGRTRAERDAGV